MPQNRTAAPPTPIVGPPIVPAQHSLLASAQEIKETDDRWLGGLAWVPETTGFVWGTWDPMPLDENGARVTGGPPVKSEAGTGATEILYQPFVIELESVCDDADREGIQARATRQLEGITPLALEEEFWDGALHPLNPSLRGSTPNQAAVPGGDHHRAQAGILNPTLGTAVSPSVALRLLTLGLARAEIPGKGMIHAPAHVVDAWDGAGFLDKDGPRLVTKSRGDTVVAYSGGSWSGPSALAGAGTADLDTHWAFATGPVQIRLSPAEPYEQTVSEAWRRRTGRIGYRIERTAAVTFDPTTAFAVKIDSLT